MTIGRVPLLLYTSLALERTRGHHREGAGRRFDEQGRGFAGTRVAMKKGFQTCAPSRSELEMTDLEALVVAAYVFADEYRVPARGGRPPLISDAELVALAVAQAAIGISSDRQFLSSRSRCRRPANR